jgi:hypothetical protein
VLHSQASLISVDRTGVETENTGQSYGRQRETDYRLTSSNQQALDSNAPPYSSHIAQNERAANMLANGNNRRSEN